MIVQGHFKGFMEVYKTELLFIQSVRHYLEGIDHSFDVCFDGFMGKLRASQRAHTLQSQIPQVRLSVLQELAQLVTCTHQKVRLTEKKQPKTYIYKGVILFPESLQN